uniref:EF-hand domain-containing protein n=1 Tax=Hippocampus comes TaxID=109280 RepID=A0A3Q2Z885_HIPCM
MFGNSWPSERAFTSAATCLFFLVLLAYLPPPLPDRALGVPLADLSFEDRDITFSEGPLRIHDPSSLLEFNLLVRRLGLKITNGLLKEQASRARKLLRHQLNLEDLACFLHLPVTNTLREVLSLFDEEGHIDIRHFVIAMSTIYRPSRSMETLKLAFEMYENEDSGEVHEDELASALEIMLGVKEVELSMFFMELDGPDSGKITYDKLRRFIEQHPRFVHDYLDFKDHPRRSCAPPANNMPAGWKPITVQKIIQIQSNLEYCILTACD